MSEPTPAPVASAPVASAAASPVPAENAVHFTIDGRPATGRKGEMLIAAAERAGTFIPRFCYHPRMKPVGMCRMCLVEVSGPRGASLQPSCFVEVAEGSEVVTTSDKVKKAQDGVLEFLLINHPLDCPVCDKGGECPLQDQTLAYGPGETRFVEEKRHFEKPIPISDLVLLDRERCIQCGRCTRFAAEIAGEAEIDFIGRGDSIEVNTFPELPFTSYFSGNTIQICPVGALTATQYRFTARPWDLDQVESTCTTCAVGCRVAVQSSANRVTRLMGIDAEPVNHGWLCDKGRFAYESVNSDERLVEPMVRKDGELVPATWYEALRAVADGLKKAAGSKSGGSSAQGVGVIGGARLTNEGAYAWAKLAKGVLGTDSVDAQLGDGLPAELVLGLPRATIDQAATADTVVLLSGDLREELPVLFLRLRSAVVDGDLSVVELSPQTTSLTPYAAASLRYRAGEATGLAAAVVADGAPAPEGVDAGDLAQARRLVAAENVVVVVGRPSLAEDATLVAQAAQALAAALPNAKFLPALRRGNVNGALDMGLAPGLLPGRTTLEDGRAWFTQAWGGVPSERGLDTAGMLGAAEAGHLGALVLLGADPRTDFPDRGLAQRALDNIDFIVSIATSPDPSTAHADVVLPVAADHERPGTTTNIEGRISRVGQKLVAPGQAWADWVIAAELAVHLDGDLGLGSLSEVWDEIERLAPAYRGITGPVLEVAASVDGIVAPLTATPVELSRRQSVAPLDPIAVPGVESVERQGAPARAGFAEFRTAETAETATGQRAANGNGDGNGASVRPALISGPMELDSPHVPVTDSYSHRLVAGRRLYDHGAAVSSIPSLAGLVGASPLRANPHDLDDLGVGIGGHVRVRTAKASAVVEVAPDPALPRRVVAVDFNVPLGDGTAGDLIDSSLPVTELRMETP
ncbi:MAG TPA: NADH-quinone oxidoreductase subunit NuoG [Acidimicrobiales bacterium]|nr:NADH-quinone oxidoreductase subunit NuoG [Acidimicrobiales bacterium]